MCGDLLSFIHAAAFSGLAQMQAEVEPETMGRWIGLLLVGGGLLAGLLKCFNIMKRPTTSALCVLAMAMYLIAILIQMASQQLLPEFIGYDHIDIVLIICRILSALIMVAALVVAIVGLSLYDRDKHDQGRKQAVWTIMLSLLFLISFTFRLTREIAGGTYAFLNHKGDGERATSLGSTDESKEGNCALTAPPGWRSVNGKLFNAETCIAFRRFHPEGIAMVISERLENEIPAEDFTMVVKDNLKSAVRKLHSQREERVNVRGRDLVRIISEVEVPEVPGSLLYYEHWLLIQGRRSLQLVVFGEAKERTLIARDARTFADSLRILNPDLDLVPVVDDASEALGYATDLQSLGWRRDPQPTMQGATFAVETAREYLALIPLRFEDEAPKLSTMATGMLSSLDLLGESGEMEGTPLKHPMGEAIQYESERAANGKTWRYVYRVIRGDRMGWLMAGWAEKDKGDYSKVVQSMERISLHEPIVPLPEFSPTQRRGMATLYNGIGLTYVGEQKLPEATPFFQAARTYDGDDPAYADNLAAVLVLQGEDDKAMEITTELLPRFPKYFPMVIRHAKLQAGAGQSEESLHTFEQAIKNGLTQEDLALGWMQALSEKDQSQIVLKGAKAWMEKHGSENSKLWHAQALSSTGEHVAAIQSLEDMYKKSPKSTKIALELAELCNSGSEYARAEELAQAVLKNDPNQVRALLALGWSQMGKRWYREAKATFERATKMAPGNALAKDALGMASAQLGQGDNSNVKQSLDQVEIPREVLEDLSIAPEKDQSTTAPDDRSLQPLLRVIGYHHEKGKPIRKTTYARTKVLTRDGVNHLSTMEFSFDPLAEQIYVNKIEVTTESGKKIQGSIDDAYVLDASVEGAASQDKVLRIQIPGVEPGATVEVIVTQQDKSGSDLFSYVNLTFPEARAAGLFVTGEVGDIKSSVIEGVLKLKTRHRQDLISWTAHHVPNTPEEPMSTAWLERETSVALCGGKATWADVARDYLKNVEDVLKPDKAATDLALQLTQGLNTDQDKIRKISQYVQDQLHYKAIAFGVRARRPHPPVETLRQRYGDCKDHSLLLHQMLQAVGIRSALALVNTDKPTLAELPSLDQFNHMVVHVPSLGPEWLMDPTDKGLALDQLPSQGLWHARALVLDGDDSRLLELPPPPAAGSSKFHSQRVIRAEMEDWMVEEVATFQGYAASWLRSNFQGDSPEEVRRKLQSLLSTLGHAELEEYSSQGLEDASQDYVLKLKYRLKRAIQPQRALSQAAGGIPTLWETFYTKPQYVKNRKTNYQVIYPFQVDSQVTIHTPEPVSLGAVESISAGSKNTYCDWSLEGVWDNTDPKPFLRISFQYQAKPGKHSAATYPQYYDAMQAIRTAWQTPLSWKSESTTVTE